MDAIHSLSSNFLWPLCTLGVGVDQSVEPNAGQCEKVPFFLGIHKHKSRPAVTLRDLDTGSQT